MDSCCQLGRELVSSNKLHETDNFFVVPTVGPIGIEGYLLICSKTHFEGIGEVPEEHEKELEDVLKTSKKVLREVYNSDVIVFEHGPRIGCHSGGGCLDHAHLHVLPINSNVIEPLALSLLKGLSINFYYKLERIDSFRRLREISILGVSSYMFVETDNKRYTTEVNFFIPSQYIRRMIGSQIGSDKWDWRLYPDLETFDRTLERLQRRF